MPSFAVISRIDHLPRLLSDLAGLSRLQAAHGGAGVIQLLGVWVEHRPDRPATTLSLPGRLTSGPLRVTTPLELSAVWAVCSTDRPDLSRGQLIDAVLEGTQGTVMSNEGRFIPIFDIQQPAHYRHLEWQALTIRYPGIVLPPLAQSPSGAITFVAFGDPFPAAREDDWAEDRRRLGRSH